MRKCPKCRSEDIHHSRTKSRWENWRKAITDRRPLRCRACGWRGWGHESPRKFRDLELEFAARVSPDAAIASKAGGGIWPKVSFDAIDGECRRRPEGMITPGPTRRRIALVAPDALTILLFWTGLIRTLRDIPGVELVVLCDVSSLKSDVEALGVETRHTDADGSFNLFADLKYLTQLTRILRQERCDGALVCCTKPNVYGAIAARLAGVKRVTLHVLGLGAAFVPGGGMKRAVIRLGLKTLYRIAGRLSTNVWFTNVNDAEYFVERGLVSSEQAIVTRMYLDPDEYAPGVADEGALTVLRRELGLGPNDLVVVMVARMIWSKGIREFAQAAALLRDCYPDTKFLLVAPIDRGSLESVPECYIRECERLANLKWLGFRSDVKSIYALADIAVLPTYYREGGYPRALLEPMAMGKPVIASDSEDCRGAVEHGRNGYLVPVRDSHTFAAAIARLLDDPEKRARFGAYSRSKVMREFDEEQIVPAALQALGLQWRAAPEHLS